MRRRDRRHDRLGGERRGGSGLAWSTLGLGMLLDLAGTVALVYGVIVLSNPWIALGQFWFRVHVGSLNVSQAVVQRYIYPPLWDQAIVPVLLLPAFVALAVPGALLIVSGLVLLRRRARD